MGKGIDWGYGSLSGKAVADAGYDFVCRYLSHSPGKNLSKNELLDMKNNGLDVVVVWETTELRALSAYNAGVEDAQSAVQQLADLGAPSDAVVYFACDYDFSVSQQNAINDYFKGVASIIDKSRIGVYGGYGVVTRCFDADVVSYGWQTYAWSHGQWDSRAQLRQTNIYGPHLNGVACDTDESVQDDFGQF